MNIKLFISIQIVFLTISLYISGFSPSQVEEKNYFFVDPLVFYSKDSAKARLDVYIELPLENLQFKKVSSTNYEANIDYSIRIITLAGKPLINETYTETITNSINEQRKLNELSVFALKQFYLLPDKYKLFFTLKDKSSLNEYTKEYGFEVINFSAGNIEFSDIMILSSYSIDSSGKKEIVPLINNNIGNLKEFYIFFEIYNFESTPQSEDFVYRITNTTTGKQVTDGNLYFLIQPGISNYVEKISTKDLYIGDFRLDIVGKFNQKIYVTKFFTYRWDWFPISIKDIDEAINQTIYIASSQEYDYMKAAKTPEEKQIRFLKFWRDKDPNPNTPKNEIMIEYYRRVKIANERFSHYVEGWKTDMGMVYIRYGEPSNIERHPFDEDSKPYEIWDYYDINRRFVFVDYTGFGDYRLISPIWDDRPKFRF